MTSHSNICYFLNQVLHIWLLFFYSIPSRPVGSRIKVWRRLSKSGAIQLKGAVYILPYTEEHYEFFQWLLSEITSVGGEGTFVKAGGIETMEEGEIINLFNHQREADYRTIEKSMEWLKRKTDSVRKGGHSKDAKKLTKEFCRCEKDFKEIRKIDFFSSIYGSTVEKRLKTLQLEIMDISGADAREQSYILKPKVIEDYQGKIWATRKKPFVDRMASAWLIGRFIDKRALFKFIDEKDMKDMDKNTVTFDIKGGEFTHVGNLCTFEVLIKSFGLKNKALKKIAEIVHEIDIKDDRYENPESKGIEEILQGIRKIAKNDAQALEKGIEVFEMLYASKT